MTLILSWQLRLKELVLTEGSLRTYENFGIEVRCRLCGKKFKVGDRVIKTRVRAGHEENPFYCVDHFYSESKPTERR
ncbi:MAG: hypothetical protein JSV18_04195 [Candidatus Bathyarchaeota archaeon]|nr:MAG: hypothetical protein JSV18_04195 [Candidatus Bathyarchaeota archaeon]